MCDTPGSRTMEVMKPEVMIVDDNEQFLAAATLLLEREGMTVIGTASTPACALDQIDSLSPDVVLLDLHLGSVSGLVLAADVSSLDAGAPAVVILSSESYEDVRDLLVGAPVRGFVSKVDLSATAIRSIVGSS